MLQPATRFMLLNGQDFAVEQTFGPGFELRSKVRLGRKDLLNIEQSRFQTETEHQQKSHSFRDENCDS